MEEVWKRPFPLTRGPVHSHMPSDAELVESVALHGLILPVFLLHGLVLDGERRHKAALSIGLTVTYQELETPERAARVLWSLHPERALTRFCEGLTLTECCKLLGARPAEIIRYRPKQKAEPTKRKHTRRDYSRRMYLKFDAQTKRELVALSEELNAQQTEILRAAFRICDREAIAQAIKKERGSKRNVIVSKRNQVLR